MLSTWGHRDGGWGFVSWEYKKSQRELILVTVLAGKIKRSLTCTRHHSNSAGCHRALSLGLSLFLLFSWGHQSYRPTPLQYNLFLINYCFNGPISKYGPILRLQEGREFCEYAMQPRTMSKCTCLAPKPVPFATRYTASKHNGDDDGGGCDDGSYHYFNIY